MTAMWRNLCTAALVGGLASLAAACSDDGGGDGGDPDAGADTDTGGGDTGLDVEVGGDGGGDGGTCENPCTRTRDCQTAGLEGYACVDGCCEEQPTVTRCSRHLAECDSDEATTDNFICDTGVGLCLQRCSSDATLDARGGNCPVGSYCIGDVDTAGPQDPATGETLDGACLPGDCDSNIFADDACEGVATGGVTCTADTCTCLPIANGASYCISAGTAAAGEACGVSTAAEPPASDSCEAGLLCFENTCTVPCDLTADTDTCAEGTECIQAIGVTTRNKPGICGVTCDPFSSGQCAEGFVCEPALGRFDITEWMCMPEQGRNASGELVPVAGEGEACVSGTNSISGNCDEGFFCLAQETDGPTFCERTCDTTGDYDTELAGCGPTTAGPVLIAAFGYGTATAFIENDPGTVAVDVRLEDGTFVQSAEVEFAAGTATSYIATVGDYGTGALDIIPVDDLATGETLPASGVRVVHASADAGPVDGYLTPVVSADFGGVAEWVVPTTAGFVRVWAAGDDLFAPVAFTPVADTATAALVYDNDGTVTAATFAVEFGAAATSGLHFFNAGDDDVDVYANCTAEGSGDAWAGCTGDDLIGSFGAADPADSEDAILVAAEETTLYVFPAGATPATADEPLMATATPTVGAAHIVILEDAITVSPALTAPATGTAHLVAIHAVPGGPTVAAGFEGAPVVEALAYGEVFGAADAAFVDVAAGDYVLTVRAADADATTDPALEAAIEVADLHTFIATGSAAGGSLTVVAITDDTIAAPGEGKGSARVIHAAVDGPAVAVHLPGASEFICTARFRIESLPGLCGESCTPYPRTGGGNYAGCDDTTDTCFPYAATEEPGDLAGYCVEDTGTVGVGGTCDNPGFFFGQCEDGGLCLGDDFDATEGECLDICEPFTADACGDDTCSGVPPILGSWELSYCLTDAQPGEAFDDCAEEGLPCAGDFTLCLDIGDGAICYPVCREGFGDCDGFDGARCETGNLNPEVVPPFMGLCN